MLRDMEDSVLKALEAHPCYSEEAHRKYARMHVAVAPRCNIQCNYCNRKFDCTNESRPGVTSEVLTPQQAIGKIRYVKERIPNLKVIGIAGPGDALANEETFETLELVQKEFPDLTACVSTNGLVLPDCAQRLYDLGVRFVTVTINAPDAATGAKVYAHVLWQGRSLSGKEGAQVLLDRQLEGIRKCSDLGILVKCNIVMVPEVNAEKIPDLVKLVKSKGAYIVNVLPLIPVKGTAFEGMRAPTPAERKAVIDLCAEDARMMRHCRQCRADAIGMLGEDRSAEFEGCGYGSGDGCGPNEHRRTMISFDSGPRKVLVAVASDSGKDVDSGFGNASRFVVLSVEGDKVERLREVGSEGLDSDVGGRTHRERIDALVTLVDDCDVIAVREIGDMPRSVIEGRGKKVLVIDASVEDAAREAARLRPGRGPSPVRPFLLYYNK